MNLIEKQALKFILKRTQAKQQQAMSNYITHHWAQYRAGEIDFAQVKQYAKQARPMLKSESVAELTEFAKAWAHRLNLK